MIGMLHLGKMVLVGNRLLALKNKNKNKQTKKKLKPLAGT
jgi:hypothetical protein